MDKRMDLFKPREAFQELMNKFMTAAQKRDGGSIRIDPEVGLIHLLAAGYLEGDLKEDAEEYLTAVKVDSSLARECRVIPSESEYDPKEINHYLEKIADNLKKIYLYFYENHTLDKMEELDRYHDIRALDRMADPLKIIRMLFGIKFGSKFNESSIEYLSRDKNDEYLSRDEKVQMKGMVKFLLRCKRIIYGYEYNKSIIELAFKIHITEENCILLLDTIKLILSDLENVDNCIATFTKEAADVLIEYFTPLKS